MTTKITVVLEDDLDGGPADETVRFGIGGTDYEIDLNATNARLSASSSPPTFEHTCRAGSRQRHRPGADRQPGGAARTSGRGRGTRPSRSAAASASPLPLPGNTKRPREDGDAGLPYRLPGPSRAAAGFGSRPTRCGWGARARTSSRCERVPPAHSYAEVSISVHDQQCGETRG
jgi:nucleoid-associated protein Lsr2